MVERWTLSSQNRSIQHGAYGTGYPQINQGYNPNAPTNGNSSHFFLTDAIGWSTTYHELSHCQLFSKFPGHQESMVNLPYIYVATEKFGMPLVEAFTSSMNLGFLENVMESYYNRIHHFMHKDSRVNISDH